MVVKMKHSYKKMKKIKNTKVGDYILKNIRRASYKMSSIMFIYEGNVYDKNTKKFIGSFEIPAKNIDELKFHIINFPHIYRNRMWI